MSPTARVGRRVNGVVARTLAVPIYIKILGIGALVSTMFAAVVVLHARPRVEQTLYSVHQDRARASTVSLASVVEHSLVARDLFMVQQHLDNTMLAFPDMRYAIVYDPAGLVLARSIAEGDSYRRLELTSENPPSERPMRIFELEQEQITDITMPILEGRLGTLRVGTSDALVASELTAVTRSTLWALVFCLIVGQLLALILASLLTHPIQNLVRASRRLRKGDFEHRAEVMWDDEIGRLAVAFNQMADSLERYRGEVKHKEESRLALLEKLVTAQEEERRAIALELHDQLGGSILALLLDVHNLETAGELARPRAKELEKQIRWLSDEVRRIARQMRPSLLDDLGLDCALARYVEDTAARSELAIDYQCLRPDGLKRLPSELEVTLYRIAQESVTNVLRHSRAQQASVVLYRGANDATLVIEDDGVGFDVERSNGNSLGLMGMRERATLHGGDLSIQSRLGSGTTIRARMPLPRSVT